jgi:hypothetical protein
MSTNRRTFRHSAPPIVEEFAEGPRASIQPAPRRAEPAELGFNPTRRRAQLDMRLSELAGAAGRGLLAGAVGTAAMTASSTLEAKVRGREASDTPARAAAKVLGVTPTDSGSGRFNTIVHWGYGTGWGAVRGLLGALGLSGPAATLAHFAAVWGAEQVELPMLGIGQPAGDTARPRPRSTAGTTPCTPPRPGWPTTGWSSTSIQRAGSTDDDPEGAGQALPPSGSEGA